MIFRKAEEKDIDNIMIIIKQAQESLKELGVDQWQDNYPNREVILNDIENKNSYVLESEKGIVATAMFSLEKDSTYDKIYEGIWITDGPYAVIHRIAVSKESKGKNISSEFLGEMVRICSENNINSIKIDTHKDNIVMQKFLKKNNFKYCGIIYLEDNSPRIAFEKLIK